jgi:hypothetical protein
MIRKILLICGIASSLLYVAMNIIGPMQYPGYSSVSQTISELSAFGVPSRPLWIPLGIAYDVLLIAFGLGVWKSAGSKRSLRIVGGLLVAFGAVGFLWPLASMHQREVIAAGGGTLADTMHLVLGGVSVLFMFLAIWFGSKAFGKRFYSYSIWTIVALLLFGILTGIDGPKVGKNLPTPFVGIWERINIATFMLWAIVLAIVLLRGKSGQSPIGSNNT